MFLIPDLKQMEVDVSVHESMGPRVRVGMKAKVKVASVPSTLFPVESSRSTCCRLQTGRNGTKA